MNRLAELLFYIWLLSLPFNRYSLVGTLAFDQLLGPALVILWFLVRPRIDAVYAQGYGRNLAVGIILITVYFLSHNLALAFSQAAIWKYTYRFLADLPYFLVPVLYIRSVVVRRRAEDCLVLVTLIGAVSSFMVAYGLVSLPMARESANRLAIEGIELTRATGFIGAFGDMAILSAFTLMIVFSRQRQIVAFMRRSRFKTAAIVLALILGFIGSQSRNMAITVVVSMALFWLIGIWSRRRTNWIPRFYMLLTFGVATAAITLGFFFEPLFELVASLGGKAASATAQGRLEQYATGLSLLEGRYLFGVTPEVQERYELFVNSIHNMWIKEFVIGGLVALLALLAFFIIGMLKATGCLRVDPLDQAARLRLVLCIAIIISTQFNPSGTGVFWVMLGMILSNVCVHAADKAPVINRRGLAHVTR